VSSFIPPRTTLRQDIEAHVRLFPSNATDVVAIVTHRVPVHNLFGRARVAKRRSMPFLDCSNADCAR
jgi:hypothetical protein